MNLSKLNMHVSLEGRRVDECLKQPFLLGPLMHGVVMETISGDYASFLHSQPFNPFSQHVTRSSDGVLCSLRTLTDEATKEILVPMGCLSQFKLKKLDVNATVKKVETATIPLSELTEKIHNSKQTRFKLTFLTPTSFKSKGIYQVLPDLRLVYQNLISRYSLIYDGDKEVDQETIEFLSGHTKILSYTLTSRNFTLGSKRIPGFLGSMTIEVQGPQQLIGFAHMLFSFAEFSGIGIKTSLGMGGVRLA